MTFKRNATLAELEMILSWAADEGWNPGFDDANAFFAADPDGFFVAVDDSENPVAAISVVNHSASFAFLGLYIVRPEFRGQGIGLELWQHAVQHAKGRVIGLDGVEAQQDNYKASGFVHAGGTTRFTGSVRGATCSDIRGASPSDIPLLIDMECSASGVRKTAYLGAWFAQSGKRRTLVLSDQDCVVGFCTVRGCRSGAKIGPLVATGPEEARRLIQHAATIFGGDVTIDVPETSVVLKEVCESFALDAGFKTARMYLGALATPAHTCFAVTSLELG